LGRSKDFGRLSVALVYITMSGDGIAIGVGAVHPTDEYHPPRIGIEYYPLVLIDKILLVII